MYSKINSYANIKVKNVLFFHTQLVLKIVFVHILLLVGW